MPRPNRFGPVILELHGKGLCPSAIAKITGASDTHVYLVLKKANLTANRSPNYISAEDREELISMLKSGRQHKEIAEHFGITSANVSRIAIEAGLRRRAPYRKANS